MTHSKFCLLVDYFVKKNLYVTSIPGPSSIIPALQLSGMTFNSFTFNGFVSKKNKQANEQFSSSKERP